MIIVIPVEINKRELIEKIFLSTAIIKKLKAKVYLIKKHFFFKKIKNCSDLIFFDKGISITKQKLYNKLGNKNHIVAFDVESPILNWDDMTFKARLPKQILKKTKIYFTQNKKDRNKVIKYFGNHLNIISSGNPKFELSKKKNAKLIFDDQITTIKKEFGSSYIYFSSSFSADTYGGEKLWKKYTKKVYNQKNTNLSKIKQFEKFEKNDFHNYISLINLSIDVAKKFPKKTIIFRPHPTQDINLVKKRFPKDIKNLHVILKFDAAPWIYNCDWFIHTHCSTFFDAEIMKKKIILFYKSKETRHKNFFKLFDKKNHFFNDEKDVIKILKEDKKILYKNYLKSELLNYSENYTKNSHNIICNQIFKKFKNIRTKITFNNLKYKEDIKFIKFLKKILSKIKILTQKLGIIYIIDYIFELKPNMFLNYEIIKNKGSDLNLMEISHYLRKTNKIYKSKVKVKYIDNNIFLLSD